MIRDLEVSLERLYTLLHSSRYTLIFWRKEFTFFEGADLSLCPLILFLPMAFADNAFESDLSSSEQIYKLVIPARKDKIELRWKKEWRDRPIVRDTERTPNGVRLSDTKPLPYQKRRKNFQSLGRGCGFVKPPEFYDLRRAGGKLITGTFFIKRRSLANQTSEAYTAEECNQMMGQRSRSTYERYYIPTSIDRDPQGLYCGVAPRDSLIREVGRQARDLLAPQCWADLTDAKKSEIKKDSKLVDYEEKRKACREQIHALGFRNIPDAMGKTGRYDDYIVASGKFNARSSLLKDRCLKEAIKEYHETVDTLEINNQLKGIMPDNEVVILPNIDYELADRGLAAQLFFTPVDDLDVSEVFRLRCNLIKCLTRLCRQRESPRLFQQKNGTDGPLSVYNQKVPKSKGGMHEIIEIQEPPRETFFCPFCRWTKESIGPLQRNHSFARTDTIKKHILKQHLEGRTAVGDMIPCPYKNCSAFLGSSGHVMSHLARGHDQF
jgi:hypothetical protein